jgi:hypothetical protein
MLMAGTDIVYVVIAPRGNVEVGLAEKVAAIVNKDVFGARVLLTSKIPKIAGHYPTMQEAESIAQSLSSLGFLAFVCPNSEIRQPPSVRFRAHTLKLEDEEVTFWDRGHEAKAVDPRNLFLIVKGAARIRTQEETGTTKTKLNVPATLLLSIPVVKRVEEKTQKQSIRDELFVRLYDRTSLEPVVEVLQHDFDYSSLGAKKGLSTLENLNIIAAELRIRFPQAIFDARLMEHFRVDVPFATPEDEVEINCRLICLCHRAESGSGTSL